MPEPEIQPSGSLTMQQVLEAERAALGINMGACTDDQPRSALCISGGGIRSATFALGALQGLADHNLLDQFDYLSTVSGGGYIGSWLTAWIARAGGIANVIPYLRRNGKRTVPGEVDPLEHLREYNNYLSPKLGFLSADTWTLAVTVLRNILLNWLVVIPLLMGVLMLPRLVLSVMRLGEAFEEIYGTAAPISTSPLVRIGLAPLVALLLAIAFFKAAQFLPGAGGAKHSQRDYLTWVLGPLVGADVAYCVFEMLYYWGAQNRDTRLTQVILFTLVPALAGALAYALVCGEDVRQRARRLLLPLMGALVLMAACAGTAEWWLTNKVFPYTTWAQYVVIAPPALLMALDLGLWVFVGISSLTLRDEDREWLARSSAWTELFCICWMGIGALVLLLPGWIFHWRAWGNGLLGAVGGFSGWLSSRGGGSTGSSAKQPKSFKDKMFAATLKLAPAVFLVVLIVGLAIVTNWLLVHTGAVFPRITAASGPDPYAGLKVKSRDVLWSEHSDLLDHTYWGAAFIGAALLFAFSWIMARFININTFSLHDMYRNRLIRAYLGASNPKREASNFTGFAHSDNVMMRDLPAGQRPFHVVNVALNLVSSDRLSWQQRQAQSFTISPLHSGNFEVGYRPSAEFGGSRGISLGTAMTISGAAASPNMGSHSSPVVGFIMTLFNARLGAWLGNTGPAGDDTWTQAGPHSAVQSLVKEAFGLTTNRSPYVYLSDGGHFENLGLYEMVLRRCRFIVALDAGADPDFGYEDLGNALRKIRIDLAVPIDFSDALIRPLRDKKKRCAVAVIRYSALDPALQDGVLIYIKPMLLGSEPPDVESYAAVQSDFPHESTANQWFNESQTESYRMLGLHTLDEICQGWSGGSLEEFGRHVEETYLGKARI